MNDIDTLVSAIKTGNFPLCKALASVFLASHLNGNINKPISPEGHTLLHMAAHAKDPRFVSYLVKCGANPNLLDKTGYSPLAYALLMGNTDTMRMLMELGADPNQLFSDETCLLQQAVIAERETETRLLCQYGANPNQKLPSGLTPFIQAIQANSLPILRILLSSGARLDTPVSNLYPTEFAIYFHNPKMLSALLDAGAAVNQSCQTQKRGFFGNLYLVAMSEKQPECLSILNDRGCDPFFAEHSRTFSPWDIVYDLPDPDVFRLLLENPYTRKRPLDEAIFFSGFITNPSERLSLIRAALANGMPHVDENGFPTIIKTAGCTTPGILKLLVRSGDSVQTIGPNGSTALHVALCQHNASIVQTLVAMGADVNARLSRGFTCPQSPTDQSGLHLPVGTTPLHIAARNGDRDIIRLLIENGADIAALDGKNRSVLHYAAPLLQHPDDFAFLLSATKDALDPNLRDDAGDTPFMRFAKTADFRNLAAVRQSFLQFIRAGADPNLLNENGETILMHAARIGNANDFLPLLDAVTGFVDLNAVNSSGSTLLHILCADKNCNRNIASAFLHPKAELLKESPFPQHADLPPDPSLKNRKGLSALELAARHQDPNSYLFTALFPDAPNP